MRERCSLPEEILEKIFSLLRKSHRKKCPLFSLDVVVSGCGAWNGCSILLRIKLILRMAEW